MMASFCSRSSPPPKPSAVSASPSSCRQPVTAERRGNGQRRRRPGEQSRPVGERIDHGGDDADDDARERQRPHRLRQRAATNRRDARQRQPRRKGNAGREFARAAPRPTGDQSFREMRAVSLLLCRFSRASEVQSSHQGLDCFSLRSSQ